MNSRRGARPRSLSGRMEALEEQLDKIDKAREERISGIISRLSQENRESLIDAGVARLKGRELTEREVAGEQAYSAILESECRYNVIAVRGMPDLHQLISTAAERQMTKDLLERLVTALSARDQGYSLTEDEQAALQEYSDIWHGQYQRAGFSSGAEFEDWFQNQTAPK